MTWLSMVAFHRNIWKQKWSILAVVFSAYLSLFVVIFAFQAVTKQPRHVRYVHRRVQSLPNPSPTLALAKNETGLEFYRIPSGKTWREPFELPVFRFSRQDLRLQFKEVPFIDPKNPFYDNSDQFHCVQESHGANNTNVTEDLWCQPRPKYLMQYKNPCFHSSPNDMFPYGGTSCLAYFHILGTDKCGTTDFHSRLVEHPRILMNSGGLGKETYYWCWLRHGLWMQETKPRIHFQNYLRVFHKASIRIFAEYARSRLQYITGDGTPMDLWDFRGWQLEPQNKGLDEPLVLTPHVMRHMYKNPKFFVLMRDPVERLYSDYIFLGYGWSPEKFAYDVVRAVTLMRDCLKVNSTRSCFFSDDMYHIMPMRLHISCYSIFLREWLSVFHRQHFFFLRTEDYHKDIRGSIKQAVEFLELDPLTSMELDIINLTKKKHETMFKRKIGKMYPETRKLLVEFYSPFNEDLARLLEDEKYLWKDHETTTET